MGQAGQPLFHSCQLATVDRIVHQCLHGGGDAPHHGIGLQFVSHRCQDRLIDAPRGYLFSFSEAIHPGIHAPIPLPAPGSAVRCLQQASKQVGPIGSAGPECFLALQMVQDRLRFVTADQRLVRVAGNEPFRPWLALFPGAIAAARADFVVHAPDCVPSVGQSLPLQRIEAAGRPVEAKPGDQSAARLAGRAAGQVCGYGRSFVVGHQFRFQHRRPVAHGAGGGVVELVAARRPAAGAPALPDVLRHAGHALGLAGQAVPFVHRLQDRLQQHAGDRVAVGNVAVVDPDVRFVALMLENQGDMAAAGDAGSVEHQHMLPSSIGAPEGAYQRLEARPVFVLTGFDRIGKFFGNCQPLGQRQVVQRAALGVEGNITPVLAAAQVQGGSVAHW